MMGRPSLPQEEKAISDIRRALLKLCDSDERFKRHRAMTSTVRAVIDGPGELISVGSWFIKTPEMTFTLTNYQEGRVIVMTFRGRFVQEVDGLRAEVTEETQDQIRKKQ